MSVDKKVKIGTVDLTPTWPEILPTLLHMWDSGNAKSRQSACDELTRMAQLAQLTVDREKLRQRGRDAFAVSTSKRKTT